MHFKKNSLLILICLLFSFQNSAAVHTGQISEKYWKVGVSRAVITPEESLWMAGYAARNHTSEGVLHDLWTKVLAIEDANGNKAVLITNDLVAIPKIYSDRIRDRLEKEYQLKRSQIILNCSHTHSGPVLYDALRNLYPLDDIQTRKIIAYSDKLVNTIVELTGKALNSMVPSQIYAGNGITRFQVNRRNNQEALSTKITDLNGPNDYAVPVLKVVAKTGELLAVAFGYACHATVLDIYQFSGDYPGFAQIEVEKLHPGTTAMFFQGTGADQNPLPRRTVPLAQQYGRTLAAAVDRVLNEKMKKLEPVLATAYSEIDLQFAGPPPTRQDLLNHISDTSKTPDYLKQTAKTLLGRLDRGEIFEKSYPYPCQVWKMGDQAIMALGGETVTEYSLELKKLFGHDIFVLGYNNDVMAYIPSETILKEGGYEGTRSTFFTTPWKMNIQSMIISEMVKLAQKTGISQVK